MSLSADVDNEPLKWPIAPDGYIPNSVIRSWKGKRPDLIQPCSEENTLFHSLPNSSECATNNQSNATTSFAWLVEDEKDEDETFELEQEMRENEEEKNESNEDKIRKIYEKTGKDQKIIDILKASTKQKPETGEGETEEFVLQQEHNDHADTTQRKHTKVSHGNTVSFQTRKIKTRGRLEATGQFLPTDDENEPFTQQRELRNSAEFCEAITPPLQDLSTPEKHKEPGNKPAEWPKPSIKSCVGSADVVFQKQALDASTNLLTHFYGEEESPLPLSPPSSPENLQNQLKSCPPEAVQQHSFLLSSSQHNMKNQAQLALSLKALAFYKKFKACNTILSHLEKSTTCEDHPKLFSAHRNSLHLNLRSERYSSCASEFRAQIDSKGRGEQNSNHSSFNVKLSSIHNHPRSNVHSERPIFPCLTDNPMFPQSLYLDDCNNTVPEWRKTLYKLISCQGFRSSQAARQYDTEHPVELPSVTKPVDTIPLLQHGQAAAHQRVMQKIEWKDATESQSGCFNYIIPLASQQNFCTLHSSGKTTYGQLEFYWKRGSEEENLLRVEPMKHQHGSH